MTSVEDPSDTAVATSARRDRLSVDGTHGRRLRLWAAFPLAIAGGLSLLVAFPPFDVWPMAPVGVAAIGLACHRRRIRGGIGLGFVSGLAFFLPLLNWTSTQVGQFPWIALSLLEALYFAVMGAALAFAGRFLDRSRWLFPVVTALLWVGQEALRDRTPFGGFPWGRLAFSQGDSPLVYFAWLGGAALVTFVTALLGGLIAMTVVALVDRGAITLRYGGAVAGAAAVVVAAGMAMPIGLTAPEGDRVTVAVVQGNVPRLGLDFNEQRRAVLDNHVTATIALADAVAAGERPQPDVVVWPENSSDIDPIANADAAEQISAAAEAVGAPIVLGTLQRLPDGQSLNLSIVWDPETGPGFTYVKQHPVPFAEYIPMKGIVRTVAGWIDQRMVDGIDRVNGFAPGTEPGVIPVAGFTISGVICFEVAYDDLVADAVAEGAQLLAVQTNNATFDNAEATQQMAMVRLRSIEHGREGLMASTVGVSGFTDAYGMVHDMTTFNTQAVIVSELTLSDTSTPATVLGVVPELVLCVLALTALVAAGADRRRRITAQAPAAAEDAADG